MYNNPYDITPHINNPSESKMNRDSIHFPSSLASTSNKPIHQIDYNFNDRQYRTDRRKCSNVTVQNDYLQKYQIHELTYMNPSKYYLQLYGRLKPAYHSYAPACRQPAAMAWFS